MEDIVTLLRGDAVGVAPTDTLYGIVANAFSKRAVERIYEIKGRDEHKPFIILIPSLAALAQFGITLTPLQKKTIQKLWPGPVSIILPCKNKKFEYLHRTTGSLAFRLPEDVFIRSLLKKTGPLVAPSANPQGQEPAQTIREAEAYFGPALDFYIDLGKKKGKASTIVSMVNKTPEIIRQGAKRVLL